MSDKGPSAAAGGGSSSMSTRFRAPFKNLGWSNKKAPAKGNSEKKVFGVPFDSSVPQVPLVIRKVVEYFDQHGVELEGLFRISASHGALQTLIQQFDAGLEPDLSKVEDPHICSSLLKQYLRELPEPLLTFELYDCFLAATTVPPEAEAMAIKKVLAMLPLTHRITLKYLCAFLVRVSEKKEINRMTPANIAIVFAPNLLKPLATGIDEISITLTDTPYSSKLMEHFVSMYSEIFGDEPDPEPDKPVGGALPAVAEKAAAPDPGPRGKHRRSMSLSSMEEFNYGKPLPKPPSTSQAPSDSSSSSSSSPSQAFNFPPPPANLSQSQQLNKSAEQPFSPNGQPPVVNRPSGGGTFSGSSRGSPAIPPGGKANEGGSARGPSATISGKSSPMTKPSLAASTPSNTILHQMSSPSLVHSSPDVSAAYASSPSSGSSKSESPNTLRKRVATDDSSLARKPPSDKSSSSLRIPRSRAAGSFQPLDMLNGETDSNPLSSSSPSPGFSTSPSSNFSSSPFSSSPSAGAPSASSSAALPAQSPFARPQNGGGPGPGAGGARPIPPPKKLSSSGSISTPAITRGPKPPVVAASPVSETDPSPSPSSAPSPSPSAGPAPAGERPIPPPSRGGSVRGRGRGAGPGGAAGAGSPPTSPAAGAGAGGPRPTGAPPLSSSSPSSASSPSSGVPPVAPPRGRGGPAKLPGMRGRSLADPGSGPGSGPAGGAAPGASASPPSPSDDSSDGGRRRSATVAV